MTRDPLEYFRPEARELVDALTSGIRALIDTPESGDLAAVLRMAHTLKGAARVVGQTGIADLAHRLEDHLAPLRDPAQDRTSVLPLAQALLPDLDDAVMLLERPERVTTRQPDVPELPAAELRDDSFTTIRVQVGDLDVMAGHVAQATTFLGGLTNGINVLDSARRSLDELALLTTRGDRDGANATASMQALRRTLRGASETLQESSWRVEQALKLAEQVTGQVRFLPAASIHDFLEAAVADAARDTGRAVIVDFSGEETRIDAYVLSRLRDALLHVVRNAVVHGIESEAERIAAGKPATGHIHVGVRGRGGQIVVTCEDDGRGVDADAVRRVAAAQGLMNADEAAAMDSQAVTALLLRGGISTAATLSQIAGRGIGFDVVRQTAAQLNGSVSIESTSGRGTAITMTVAASLVGVPVLRVRSGDTPALFPLESIVAAVKVDTATRSASGDTILVEGEPQPFLPLANVLQQELARHERGVSMGLLLKSAEGSAVIGVDHIDDVNRVVLREAPSRAGLTASVAGVCIDSSGNPLLVMDATALVAAAREPGRPVSAPVAAKPLLPILIIDDSMTTRMLERAILESAGYSVDLAVSGEDGLAKAQHAGYSLFLVDAEMPGINGFDFIRQAKTIPSIANIPAIMVTSLNSPDDIRRSREAGALAHIVKGDFDQARFLEVVRTLRLNS